MLTRSQARARLALFGCTSEEPALVAGEVDLILDMARTVDFYGTTPGDATRGVYSTWYASMQVAVGDYVLPSSPNSHYYKVTATDGSAGATEPVWPTGSGDDVTADGVTYTEQGIYSWVDDYDVNYAISQVWLVKAGRLADRYLFMSGGKMFSRNQFQEHCMELHRKYAMKSPLKAMRLAPSDMSSDLCIQRL